MGIVEQAAKRLEELKRAGVHVPVAANLPEVEAPGGPAPGLRPLTPTEPTPAAAMRRMAAESTHAVHTLPRPARRLPADKPHIAVMLDLGGLERAGYLVPTSARSVLAEEFRHIKRPLLKTARAKEPGSSRLSQIMVTSAVPGEGKTFCSINLAMSMAAEIDTSVLLVDADVLHPTVLQRLGIAAERGLLDVLTDSALELSDVVMSTNVPKLSILAAGTRNDRATELLASNAMESLLVKLGDTYPDHVIIFDAPPLLLTNEAKVLASHIGQVVLVVEASKTPRNVVAQAFAAVEHCPNVLSVLNKTTDTATPLGYGYYYG
jgi:receptor protein-tyrosine kinase